MKKRTNKEISFLKNRAISIYKLSRTEYKQLAHSQNGVSVLGRILERGFNFRGNIFPNRLPIWSPGWHIPTQKIPKRLPPSPPGTERNSTHFAAGEAQHNVQEIEVTLLTLQTSHLSSFWIKQQPVQQIL